MKRFFYLPGILISVALLISSPARAEKIVGLGLSQSSAGTEFNFSIASTNARQFILEQMKQSVFEYKKKNKGFEITKTLKGTVANIKNKEVIYLRKKGVAVIAQAEAVLPDYADAICRRSKHKIKKASDLTNMLPKMLKTSVLKLVKSKFKNTNQLTGISYIKNLKITKWRTKGRYTIRASVCLANINTDKK